MTTYRRNEANRGAGFTLVEILIVIVIIGLLAGLTTTVLVSSRQSVSNALVSTQEAQLSIALDEYKNRYGEYPPDMSDQDAVLRHIKKRWPRYNVASYDDFIQQVKLGCKLSSSYYKSDSDYPTDVTECNGHYVWDVQNHMSSLVFWLGGLPNADGIPSGFYMSPKAPLGISANGSRLAKPTRAQREKPLFAFEKKNLGAFLTNSYGGTSFFYKVEDERQLQNSDWDAYCYEPAFCQGNYPIVYFKPSVNSGYGDKAFFLGESSSDSDPITCAFPYARELGKSWYEEKRFQLIHPGVDGMFGPVVNGSEGNRSGTPATQPKVNLYTQDADNVVNFVESGVLESEYQD